MDKTLNTDEFPRHYYFVNNRNTACRLSIYSHSDIELDDEDYRSCTFGNKSEALKLATAWAKIDRDRGEKAICIKDITKHHKLMGYILQCKVQG
jgi:hypothetical protein